MLLLLCPARAGAYGVTPASEPAPRDRGFGAAFAAAALDRSDAGESRGPGGQAVRLAAAGPDAASPRATDTTPSPEGGAPDSVTYAAGFKNLFALFVLAVLLESGLAVVFNWRPFVETFNARAVKPLLSFIAAAVFVSSFGLDIVTRLVDVFTSSALAPSGVGYALTALVLAGGSSGVNNILVALGYRPQRTPEAAAPKPPPNKAWISVKLDRRRAVGQVSVFIGTPSGAAAPAGQDVGSWSDVPLVGAVSGHCLPGIRYFLADPGRFPSYGGHEVPGSAQVAVDLLGRNARGEAVKTCWGPFTVAAGAFVDLSLEL